MADDPKHTSMRHIGADPGAGGFNGVITGRSIGRLQIGRVTIEGTQALRRTLAMIACCAQPRFALIRIRAGLGLLQHRGEELSLGTDECVLLDGREPYELTFAGGSECLWFELPVDWAEHHLPDPRTAVAVPLGRQPWAGMLRDVMDTIHADDTASPPLLIARTLCTALALTADTIEIRSTAHSRKTFKSLQATLAELASTCNVTVAEIAQAHGISPRHLHSIYSANGTRCGEELMRLRLQRAQRLLIDPLQPGRSIDDIAWQCGFSDVGHFRRRFRALFGVPPSAMRRSA